MVAHNAVHTYGVNRYFDLLKIFRYNERVVKSDFCQKRPNLLHMCAACAELPFFISNMVFLHIEYPARFFCNGEAKVIKEHGISVMFSDI